MAQGNTIVSHFVVQRADFIVAIACVPCGPCCSLIYACAWGFWVCWKVVCFCRIKPDCRRRLLWSPFLLTLLPVSCPSTAPLIHYINNINTKADKSIWCFFNIININTNTATLTVHSDTLMDMSKQSGITVIMESQKGMKASDTYRCADIRWWWWHQ